MTILRVVNRCEQIECKSGCWDEEREDGELQEDKWLVIT